MNEYEIRRFLDVMHPDNGLFEIRIIDGRRIYSGYFTDSAKAYEAIQPYSHMNVYVVLNKVDLACYSRKQKDVILQIGTTTSDGDITDRQWILIDVDPKRPSGTNASDAELLAAHTVTTMVGKYLKGAGFNSPIMGMSGNGYHLIYKVAMKNNEVNTQLVKDFIAALSMLFSTDMVGVDTSVFNPARITKVLGTYSRKGTANDAARPQRLSKLMHIPKEIKKNDPILIERVAKILPKREQATYRNNYGNDNFDIDKFINDNSIKVARDFKNGNVRKIILEQCPFDENHKAPDSALFVVDGGAIGFKCMHNSCSNHSWHDVREVFDPFAHRRRDSNRTIKPITNEVNYILEEDEELGSKFLQLHEIKNIDRSKIVTIPTRITELDKRIIGLNLSETSIMSGSSGSGKSTFVNQVILGAVDSGYNSSIWSGELTAQRMKGWLHMQAAGRQYTTQSTFAENSFYVKPNVGEKIDSWLTGRLYLYNNDYGNKFNQLIHDITEHVKEHKIKLLVLDNLMAMDILSLEGDKMQKQTGMITILVKLAKKLQFHLILVAHPRKAATFLRKNDIAGNADLVNSVDNVFIMHRVNNDFVKSAGEFYGTSEAAKYFSFHNVLECCKNRDLGIQDELFGLFFEIESKRFLNERLENVQYGWVEASDKSEIQLTDIYMPVATQSDIINAFESEKKPAKIEPDDLSNAVYYEHVNHDDDNNFPF